MKKLIYDCLSFLSFLGKHPVKLIITLVMFVFSLTFYGIFNAIPTFNDVIYKVVFIYIAIFYLTTIVLFNVFVLWPYFKNKYIKNNTIKINLNINEE